MHIELSFHTMSSVSPMYLHYTDRVINSVKDRTVQPTLSKKPIGLWLSYGTAWKEWCEENNFAICNIKKCNVYTATINEENLYVIDTFAKLIEFCEEFVNIVSAFNISWGEVTWSEVAEKYDGIVIRNYRELWYESFAHGEYTREITEWFRSYDIDCACIWRARAIQSWNTYK